MRYNILRFNFRTTGNPVTVVERNFLAGSIAELRDHVANHYLHDDDGGTIYLFIDLHNGHVHQDVVHREPKLIQDGCLTARV